MDPKKKEVLLEQMNNTRILIKELLPASRERSSAITRLDESAFWVNSVKTSKKKKKDQGSTSFEDIYYMKQ